MTTETKLPRAIIVDLDGTLTNYDHRAEHLFPPNRDMPLFFSKMEGDSVNEWCKAMVLQAQRSGITIILLTGRPEAYRPHTERWLEKHNIPYDVLLMRPDEDWRPGAIVKEEIFRMEIDHSYDITVAIDDNPRIAKMWWRIGVRCMYCGTAEDMAKDNDVTP